MFFYAWGDARVWAHSSHSLDMPLSHLGLPVGSDAKESACSAGDSVSTPRSGRSPGEENGTHSRILAWRIPWTEEPGGLPSMGSQRDTVERLTLSLFTLSAP